MSGGEMLSSLDAAFAEIARPRTFTLNLIAGLETTGYAKELGAGTTARFATEAPRLRAWSRWALTSSTWTIVDHESPGLGGLRPFAGSASAMTTIPFPRRIRARWLPARHISVKPKASHSQSTAVPTSSYTSSGTTLAEPIVRLIIRPPAARESEAAS
jgi:hypothetical protein